VRLVLDTNIWLDWLVFGDPGAALLSPLLARRGENTAPAQIFIDVPCLAEFSRVLAYDLGRHSIDAGAQQRALAECARLATRIDGAPDPSALARLPKCRDRDDQKFLALALAARADCLVTKDRELLALARRTPFAIVTLDQLGQRVAAPA
jgi:putative PIN family toxin of toxin-antitoxin system